MAEAAPGSPTKRSASDRRRRAEQRPGEGLAGFYVMATGQIESAEFHNLDHLFCRYSFVYGPDWRVMQGIDSGFSQVAQKGGGDGSGPSIVWNFPVDITFKATNPFGWPRLVISVFSQDFFGRYVVRGYGSVLLPTVPGTYVRDVRTFAPASSTLLQAGLAWLTGNLPEFYDARFAAAGEGREVVRTSSVGVVRVSLSIVTRGMAAHGFVSGGPPDALPDASSYGHAGGAGGGAGGGVVSGSELGGFGAGGAGGSMLLPRSMTDGSFASPSSGMERRVVLGRSESAPAGEGAHEGGISRPSSQPPPLQQQRGRSGEASSGGGEGDVIRGSTVRFPSPQGRSSEGGGAGHGVVGASWEGDAGASSSPVGRGARAPAMSSSTTLSSSIREIDAIAPGGGVARGGEVDGRGGSSKDQRSRDRGERSSRSGHRSSSSRRREEAEASGGGSAAPRRGVVVLSESKE